MTFTKKKPNEKIIVMIFAGRKDFIEIGMKYLLFLLGKGKIDEIHFWLFIGDTYNFRYMNSISNLHKTSKYFNDYLEIYPKIIGNKVDLSIKGEGNAFILLNDKIEIVIDAESEELKQNLTSQFKGEKLIFIDDIIDKNNYTIISLKFVKNNLIIQNKKKLLKSISTNEISFTSIKIHSGYNKEVFWDYTEVNNIGIKSFDTEDREKLRWYEAYKFYLEYDYNILIKMDDDIVFIDVNRFDDFIKFIKKNPDKNIILPNIINQCISSFYNNKKGLIPDEILLENYRNKKSPNDFFQCYADAELATNLHNYFFTNTQKFLNFSYKPISLNNHNLNVCFFGVSKKNYIKSFDPKFIKKKGYDIENFKFDEIHIYKLKGNYFFPNFVVSHYAFKFQRNNGIDKDKSILKKYKELSNSIL